MTNIAFCRPGTQVVSLVPATMPDTFFWFICAHRRLDYEEVRCPQASQDATPAWNNTLRLTDNDLAYLRTL